MPETIPSEMRAIQLEQHHEDVQDALRSLRVITKPVPRPGRGQVLVRIEAAPCNPSDLAFLQGSYGAIKTLPTVPGWEGVGTIVASGGGMYASLMKGKRVACGGQADADGTWAEYYITDAKACVPLIKDISTEQGATMFINPLTALALFEKARRGGHRAIVQTAGASQLGRMLLQLAQDAGVPIISIVRRTEQEEILRSLGAHYVLNSESEDFEDVLREEGGRLGATIAFDAVAGEMTGKIFNALPDRSTVVVYGYLSYSHCSDINPRELIFHNKSVEGFWLTDWLSGRGFFQMARVTNRIQQLITRGTFATTIQSRLGLDDVSEGLLAYQEHMTEGKALIVPTSR